MQSLSVVAAVIGVMLLAGTCVAGEPLFGEAPTISRNSATVLVIPGRGCGDAPFVLARVTRHIREGERSALFSATAEDEFDDGLRALIEGDCAEGIEHLRISDRELQKDPTSEFFMAH
jgi:hypothetical protein